MAHQSGLGKFFQLPPEIRDMIWENISVGEVRESFSDNVVSQLAILQTSRQIFAEASALIYSNISLTFVIHPYYVGKEWIVLKTDAGFVKLVEDVHHARELGLTALPFSKVQRISVKISAPYYVDPGQMICLWYKSVDVAELLSHAADGLADLELSLDEKRYRMKWLCGETPNTTLGDNGLTAWFDFFHPNFYQCDYHIALLPFLVIRQVRVAQISASAEMKAAEGGELSQMESVLRRSQPFGTWREPGSTWDDNQIQVRYDNMFLDMESLLDRIDGITADLMRLERCRRWYSRSGVRGGSGYERRLTQIVKRMPSGYERDLNRNDLERRYAYMRMKNPVARLPDRWRELYDSIRRGTSSMTDAALIDLFNAGSDDDWDPDSWYILYPRGCGGLGSWRDWRSPLYLETIRSIRIPDPSWPKPLTLEAFRRAKSERQRRRIDEQEWSGRLRLRGGGGG